MSDDYEDDVPEIQAMIDAGEVSVQEVQAIRLVAHRIGTDGVQRVAASAWDENGDPRY